MARGEKKSSGSSEMTFFEHIGELRPHLVRAALVLVVLSVVAFMAKDFIIDTVLFGPKSPTFPTNRFMNWVADHTSAEDLRMGETHFHIINTTLAGQFNLHLRVAFVTGLILAIPYLLWEIWQFVKPALTVRERRGTNKFVLYVSLCFFTGLLFGYFMIAPVTVNFLAQYTASGQIENFIDVDSYLSTILNVTLATAAVFQLPILVYFLTRMGVITAAFMRRYRRHAIVVLLIFAVIITPPDIFSCTMVAVPLLALYELSILISSRVRRQMDRRRAEQQTEFTAIPSTLPTEVEE